MGLKVSVICAVLRKTPGKKTKKKTVEPRFHTRLREVQVVYLSGSPSEHAALPPDILTRQQQFLKQLIHMCLTVLDLPITNVFNSSLQSKLLITFNSEKKSP